MSYLVLARRYRPQNFAELVGQEHVAVTLKNAVKSGRTAHAYLFTGPRGVGKTSAARILAKALRCLEIKEDGEPCNQCVACTSINSGSSLDVLEIDAASNTGVDNIRDLRDGVGYTASIGKFRVYIIDEVHMLSTAAFNALLKTLEEPPPHIVFIFATTELHKVLPTIQSRCQRFDFKKITPNVMEANLRGICDVEKVNIDQASLRTLIVESDGCLRDAQSLLDQAIAFCGNDIVISKLELALGLLNRGSFLELASSLGDHDPAKALQLSSQLFAQGVDPKVLLNRLVEFLRDLHYRAFTGSSSVPDPDFDKLMDELVEKLASDEIVRGMDLALRAQSTLYTASNAAFLVESLLVKLCLQRPAASAAVPPPTPEPKTTVSAAAPAAPRPANFWGNKAASAPSPAPMAVASNPSPSPGPVRAPQTPLPAGSTQGRARFETYIRNANKIAWLAVVEAIRDVKIEAACVTVSALPDTRGKRLASSDGLELLKLAYAVPKAVVNLEAAQPATGSPATPDVDKRKMAREHEAVVAAMKVFNATIVDTKVLDNSSQNKGDPKRGH